MRLVQVSVKEGTQTHLHRLTMCRGRSDGGYSSWHLVRMRQEEKKLLSNASAFDTCKHVHNSSPSLSFSLSVVCLSRLAQMLQQHFSILAIDPSGIRQEANRNQRVFLLYYLCKGTMCVGGSGPPHHQSRNRPFTGIALHVCLSVSLGLRACLCLHIAGRPDKEEGERERGSTCCT